MTAPGRPVRRDLVRWSLLAVAAAVLVVFLARNGRAWRSATGVPRRPPRCRRARPGVE
ncbi:hypothetical protein V2I01_20845 [Micromonospora sp. BRA006-A]|nr:hypothetical protein [Micromonospora sp. BRA006-A]